MSWLDGVKGLLYEDGGTPAKAPTVAPTPIIKPAIGAQAPMTAGVNAEMVEVLRKVIANRNSALTRLLQAADTLADVIPDPAMRLKAAHKTAANGQSGQQIAQAIDVHLSDIKAEVGRFTDAVNAKRSAETAQLQTAVSSAAASIESAQRELEALQARMTVLNTTIAELNVKGAQAQADLGAVGVKYDASVSEFNTAASVVSQELEANRAAILSTLK